MAANIMMDVLRKIQRDLTEQKEYMRNLHVIHRNMNEKFNIMTEKFNIITEKFDQQQVTMQRLEQQVKKNNTLLFGNDESEIFKDIPHLDHNEGLKQPEKYLESNEANQLQTLNKEAHMEEMEWNAEEDNKKNDQPTKPDSGDVHEFVDIAKEMREIKDLIADFVKTGKALVEESSPILKQGAQVSPTCLSTEEVGQLNGDLKLIISEISEIKELLTIKQQKTCADETAAPAENNNAQTVQISPAYFSTDQISKLNSELKRITEAYQMFPNIEVVPNTSPSDDHPVMKALCAGVFYEAKKNTIAQYLESYGIKLGTSGFKRAAVRDLLTEYPDLTLYEVVKEGLKSTNEWSELSKIYDFTCPRQEPRTVRCTETVQISPTYFDPDQITKLNSELKLITKKYLDTNILPNIEVVPCTSNFDNHPVMKALTQGIFCHKTETPIQLSYNTDHCYRSHCFQITINHSTPGLTRYEVEAKLKNEPHITVYDFIKRRNAVADGSYTYHVNLKPTC